MRIDGSGMPSMMYRLIDLMTSAAYSIQRIEMDAMSVRGLGEIDMEMKQQYLSRCRPCKAIDECSYSISSEGSHRGSTSSSDVSYKIQVIDWRSNDSEDDTAENNDPPSNGKDQTPDDKEVAQRRRPLPGRTYRAST